MHRRIFSHDTSAVNISRGTSTTKVVNTTTVSRNNFAMKNDQSKPRTSQGFKSSMRTSNTPYEGKDTGRSLGIWRGSSISEGHTSGLEQTLR